MTIEIEIIEPRAQRLLEELVNLNLIKFIKNSPSNVPTHKEHSEGLSKSIQDVNAAMRGEIKLRNAWDLLKELENEPVS